MAGTRIACLGGHHCADGQDARETLERVGAGRGDEIDVRIEAGLYAASAGDLLNRLHEVAFQGSWDELTPGAAELVAFVQPRELEGS